jgi:small subunit ribosomal protein S16
VEKVLKNAGLYQRYERFKSGEPVETLLAEAAAAETARNIDPRTRRETPVKKTRKAEAE